MKEHALVRQQAQHHVRIVLAHVKAIVRVHALGHQQAQHHAHIVLIHVRAIAKEAVLGDVIQDVPVLADMDVPRHVLAVVMELVSMDVI